MAHNYRLCITHDFNQGPISDEQEKILEDFHKRYHPLETASAKKKRVTLHLSSDSVLEKETLIAQLPGFQVTDFYEVG